VVIGVLCWRTGLLSDEQCKARDVRRKARQRAPTSRRNQRVSSSGTDNFVLDALVTPPQSTEGESGTTSNPLDRLSPDVSDLIRKLVHYQDMYELPKEDDYKNVQVCFFSVAASNVIIICQHLAFPSPPIGLYSTLQISSTI
jgi:hypothetical protein